VLGTALALGALAVLGALFVRESEPKRAAPDRRPLAQSRSQASDMSEKLERRGPTAEGRAPPSEREAVLLPVAATSEAKHEPVPETWPPERAFTARCRAPGGGCVETCTTLAGGRCLDPCFIHTKECSNDCRKPDGTCGWPPPDDE
jgi:hypothetical protein